MALPRSLNSAICASVKSAIPTSVGTRWAPCPAQPGKRHSRGSPGPQIAVLHIAHQGRASCSGRRTSTPAWRRLAHVEMHGTATALESVELVCGGAFGGGQSEHHQLAGLLVQRRHQFRIKRKIEDVDRATRQLRQVGQEVPLLWLRPRYSPRPPKKAPGRHGGSKTIRALAVIQHKQVGLVGVWANGQARQAGEKSVCHGGFEAKVSGVGAIRLKTDDLVLPPYTTVREMLRVNPGFA